LKVTPLAIPDVLLFEPQVFPDDRGLFFESFNTARFEAATGLKREFPQDNHSLSRKGVLRGLHYQLPPFEQGKLVRVVRGAAFDVAVDIRCGSPSFGQWAGEILSADNRRQLWIPEGFAHGFLALAEGTELLYKTTNPYDPASERAVRWDDPQLDIRWPLDLPPVTNARDGAAPLLLHAVSNMRTSGSEKLE
jgi:dTDP-4-dehydrorhamnose 3,5-epimerase